MTSFNIIWKVNAISEATNEVFDLKTTITGGKQIAFTNFCQELSRQLPAGSGSCQNMIQQISTKHFVSKCQTEIWNQQTRISLNLMSFHCTWRILLLLVSSTLLVHGSRKIFCCWSCSICCSTLFRSSTYLRPDRGKAKDQTARGSSDSFGFGKMKHIEHIRTIGRIGLIQKSNLQNEFMSRTQKKSGKMSLKSWFSKFNHHKNTINFTR